jgi:hypothetical protein
MMHVKVVNDLQLGNNIYFKGSVYRVERSSDPAMYDFVLRNVSDRTDYLCADKVLRTRRDGDFYYRLERFELDGDNKYQRVLHSLLTRVNEVKKPKKFRFFS